jgi:ATP-dependent exoDNAse (exonuclease V) alpha subunit
MAIYYLRCKAISRGAGRSATGAAAYRSAERIRDLRTGEVHNHRRKQGVRHCEIVLPENAPLWANNREQLWNAAEAAEKRKDSQVAREFELALPSELSAEQQKELALDFARELVARHGCAVDVAIHDPTPHGDQRNHHAHLLCSTRRLTSEGFTEKTRELDDPRSGEILRWRERWATLQNQRLQEYGHAVRVDHRSLEDQGIDREPTRHRGLAITALERRGERSVVVERWHVEDRQNAITRLQRAAELGRLELEAEQVNQAIFDVSSEVAAARLERDVALGEHSTPTTPAQSLAETLWEQFRKQGALDRQIELDITKDRSRSPDLPRDGPSLDL